MQQSITKSYLAALLMAIIVGFSYLATKLGLRDGNPIEILAHRFTFALLGLIILFIFGFFRFKLEKGDFLKILPLSLLNPILFFGLQILGVARVATSEAGIIQASTPILTMMLASFFLKEKTNNLQKFFVFLSLFGVVYISLMKPMSGNPGSLLGVFLLFLSSLSNAINLVFIRKLVPKYGFQKITSIVIFSGFVFFNGLYLANKIIQGEVSTYFQGISHKPYLLSLLFLGVFSTLGSSLLANYALRSLEASRTSIFNHLATIISIFAGVIVLNETLHGYQILGGLFIILGVVGTNYFANKKSTKNLSKS